MNIKKEYLEAVLQAKKDLGAENYKSVVLHCATTIESLLRDIIIHYGRLLPSNERRELDALEIEFGEGKKELVKFEMGLLIGVIKKSNLLDKILRMEKKDPRLLAGIDLNFVKDIRNDNAHYADGLPFENAQYVLSICEILLSIFNVKTSDYIDLINENTALKNKMKEMDNNSVKKIEVDDIFSFYLKYHETSISHSNRDTHFIGAFNYFLNASDKFIDYYEKAHYCNPFPDTRILSNLTDLGTKRWYFIYRLPIDYGYIKKNKLHLRYKLEKTSIDFDILKNVNRREFKDFPVLFYNKLNLNESIALISYANFKGIEEDVSQRHIFFDFPEITKYFRYLYQKTWDSYLPLDSESLNDFIKNNYDELLSKDRLKIEIKKFLDETNLSKSKKQEIESRCEIFYQELFSQQSNL